MSGEHRRRRGNGRRGDPQPGFDPASGARQQTAGRRPSRVRAQRGQQSGRRRERQLGSRLEQGGRLQGEDEDRGQGQRVRPGAAAAREAPEPREQQEDEGTLNGNAPAGEQRVGQRHYASADERRRARIPTLGDRSHAYQGPAQQRERQRGGQREVQPRDSE